MDAEDRTKDTVKQRHAKKFALPATVALHGPEPAACINDCSDLRSKRHYKRKTSHKTEHSLGRDQARSQVVCWGGAKHVISGLNHAMA